MPVIDIAVVAITRIGPGRTGCDILLTRRPKDAHLGGLWEFPGGKFEPGETPLQAGVREVHEELGLTLIDPTFLLESIHRYPDRTVRLHLVQGTVAADAEPTRYAGVAGHQWVQVEALPEVPMPEANRPLIAAMHSHLGPTANGPAGGWPPDGDDP